MKKVVILIALIIIGACGTGNVRKEKQPVLIGMVFVEGNGKNFYLGKYTVTQKEWNKYNNGKFASYEKDDDIPVSVTWLEAVLFCNIKSIKEGYEPVYNIKKLPNSNGVEIIWDEKRNGYRLPTESEWEFAAKGGKLTQGYKYSGSNNIDEVAWYKKNSQNKIHIVGQKKPNELGLYDMTGNVAQWCWDIFLPNSTQRVVRGGGAFFLEEYISINNREPGTIADLSNLSKNGDMGGIAGFRLARTAN